MFQNKGSPLCSLISSMSFSQLYSLNHQIMTLVHSKCHFHNVRYFVTLFMDTTLGVFASYCFLKCIEDRLKRKGHIYLISGNYIVCTVVNPTDKTMDQKDLELNSNLESCVGCFIKIDYKKWF